MATSARSSAASESLSYPSEIVLLMGWLLGSSCVLCRCSGPPVCRSCWSRLPAAQPGGAPALFSYEGEVARLVAALKFRDRRCLAPFLAQALARFARFAGSGGEVDVVAWAPTSIDRRRVRGYDQAELLARGVAFEMGVPFRNLLAREPGSPQTGRTRVSRCEGPAFVTIGAVGGLRILVVDDVVTTGATLHQAGHTLIAAGAARVRVLALAKTPKRSDEPPAARPQPKGAVACS